MPQRFKITVAYDGSEFAGWQIQPRDPSIQGHLEDALGTLTREKPRVHGSGRTDAGVHARAQVAHFDLEQPGSPRKLLAGLNAVLPEAIRVERLTACADSFHARFSAIGKEYRYFIWNGPVVPPFVTRYRARVPKSLDLPAMQSAAAQLEGEHDFAAFSANPNREVDGTVRRVSALKISGKGRELTLRACGDGFLYKMVRSLAGFLIRVGQGDLPPEAAHDILSSQTRTATVPTADARGLFLWRVRYR